ncbi:hypothetical protein WME89_19075 [Sorangium sp. So ce321]|uniref:type II toxin-antitoxin system VapC family toxin n=1 Tax=Sorangium sp. So ce321 TaxID=3133300 RepID=UPI003F5F291D
MILVLDTNILGKLVHPNARVHAPVLQRLAQRQVTEPGVIFRVPEISDYELRRELVLNNFQPTIARLDQLGAELGYLAITTRDMREACRLWATARRSNQQTASQKELDGDVILAAQALGVGGTVATTNVRHLSRYVAVEDWS